MKRAFKCALSAILGVFVVAPAFGQDNFPDVPENHWAFDALSRLKKAGILVGYPDGLFRGGRPASRYEMAVAINAAYQNLHSITDGLQSQIDALKAMSNAPSVTQADLQALRDQLANLQNQLNALSGLAQDVASLRRLADTFQKELQSLGVDVEAMKRDLGDLADRVTKLERRKPAVDITGDANWWLGAGQGTNGRYGLDTDGRYTGISNAGVPGVPAATTSLANDLTILHEIALNLAGTNDTGPRWYGTIVVGNALGAPDTAQGFGNQSVPNFGTGYTEAPEDIYLQDFGVKWDASIAGLNFSVDAGRVPFKISPYIFQREAKASYYSDSRWDNGEYYLDGGILGFKFGGAKLDVFGGNTSKITSVNGVEINPIQAGPINGAFGDYPVLTFDRTVGATLDVPLTAKGNLNLAYILLDSNGGIPVDGTGANRLATYGADLKFMVGNLELSGGYSKSDLEENETVVNNTNNSAWHVEGKYDSGGWGVGGGYREIEANYLAAGDWGQLGIERNPTNIKGFNAGGHLDLSRALTIKARGEWDTGKSNDFGGTTGFDTGTDIASWDVGLNWRVNRGLSLMLGYLDTEFTNLDGAVVANNPANTSASYKWTTFGIGYGLSDTSKLTIQYQVSDVSNDYQIVPGGGGRFTGGFLTTQLSIKF